MSGGTRLNVAQVVIAVGLNLLQDYPAIADLDTGVLALLGYAKIPRETCAVLPPSGLRTEQRSIFTPARFTKAASLWDEPLRLILTSQACNTAAPFLRAACRACDTLLPREPPAYMGILCIFVFGAYRAVRTAVALHV